MILCNDCGEQNEDGTVFCTRCGVFLEWEGERVTEPAAATVLPEPDNQPVASVIHPGPDAPRLGRTDRQPVVPIHPHTTDPSAHPGPSPASDGSTAARGFSPASGGSAAARGTSPASGGFPTARGSSPAPDGSTSAPDRSPASAAFVASAPNGSTAPGGSHEGARGLGGSPVDGPASRQPEHTSRQPQSRQPQTVKRRMPRRSKSPVVVPTGSRICGGCGMPNEAVRRFCAKCGFSLVDARIVRKAPWWRRLFGRERVYAAGTRLRPSGARRRFQGATRLVALLAVLGGAGILAGPQRGLVMDGVHWVQNAVSDPFPVRPESPKASGSVGKQTAPLAFDGARNTYWAAPRAGRTARPVPVLIGTFPKPVKLVRFGIWPGVSDQTPKFVAGPRPAEIELTVNTGTGPIVKRFPVKDTPTFQQFDFKADDVRTFHLAVTKTTRPTRAILTAISEVEFFAHR